MLRLNQLIFLNPYPEGMMVYVKNTYGSVTGDKYYTYSLGIGESRDASTGAVPHALGNWTEVSPYGGSSISVIMILEMLVVRP